MLPDLPFGKVETEQHYLILDKKKIESERIGS